MIKFLLVFCVVTFIAAFVNAETSYECFQKVLQKMNNSSCPLITPEIERNRDDYARLYTACTKGHYIIYGCNETEWVQACTQRVANIPSSSSSDSLRGYHDVGPMMKYCNEGVKDSDFDCLQNAVASYNNESCPEFTKLMETDPSLKVFASENMACIKSLYIKNKCNETQWTRVCNRQADRFNVDANGGQEYIDLHRSHCSENPAYDCFEKAIQKMNKKSCPEVVLSKAQNDSEDEIMRHQTSCYKRIYINQECNIFEWKKVCNLFTFTFKRSEKEKSKMMKKYCKN
jgi:hypothetical protein